MISPDWFVLGGWRPQWSKVLAQAVHDGYAAVLVDSNGDGRELWFEVAQWDDAEGWDVVVSDADVSGTSISEFGGLLSGWGRGVPGDMHSVEHRGKDYVVDVDASGWWVLVRAT